MKKSILLATLLLCINAGAFTLETEILPGEQWWGGTDRTFGTAPYGQDSEKEFLLTVSNYSNHAVPFFISSKGRYIWSESAFDLTIASGKITAVGDARIELVQAGRTIRDAFKDASVKHFPGTGTLPPEEFVTKPQYNTWIELTSRQNQKDILAYAEAIVANGFPTGGVLMIDGGWHVTNGNYAFKPDRFPDPKAMCERLHELGFKVMLWVCPFITTGTPQYEDLRDKGYLLLEKNGAEPAIVTWWAGRSAEIDFTNPDARDWFIGKLKGLQEEFGVDGFKFDAGDALYFPDDQVRTFDGKSRAQEQSQLWAELGYAFPYNEFRASWKMGGKPVVLRLQDKDYSWGGVGELLPDMITAGITGHICVCPDMIGGGESSSFRDIDWEKFDQELMVRSCQIHAVMPMMQFSVAPWRILDEEHLQACREAAALHVALGDYMIEQALKSAKENVPFIRPMDYSFPGQGFEACADQYMLGDKYLMAPMVVSGNTRTVKLPEGIWYDETGRRYRGGKTYTIDVPLNRIPMFSRTKD